MKYPTVAYSQANTLAYIHAIHRAIQYLIASSIQVQTRVFGYTIQTTIPFPTAISQTLGKALIYSIQATTAYSQTIL